jgi:hypothetical protein
MRSQVLESIKKKKKSERRRMKDKMLDLHVKNSFHVDAFVPVRHLP